MKMGLVDVGVQKVGQNDNCLRPCVPNLLIIAKAHIYAKRCRRGRPMWDLQG